MEGFGQSLCNVTKIRVDEVKHSASKEQNDASLCRLEYCDAAEAHGRLRRGASVGPCIFISFAARCAIAHAGGLSVLNRWTWPDVVTNRAIASPEGGCVRLLDNATPVPITETPNGPNCHGSFEVPEIRLASQVQSKTTKRYESGEGG